MQNPFRQFIENLPARGRGVDSGRYHSATSAEFSEGPLSAYLVVPGKERNPDALRLIEQPRVLIENPGQVVGPTASKLLGLLGIAIVITILATSAYLIVRYVI